MTASDAVIVPRAKLDKLRELSNDLGALLDAAAAPRIV